MDIQKAVGGWVAAGCVAAFAISGVLGGVAWLRSRTPALVYEAEALIDVTRPDALAGAVAGAGKGFEAAVSRAVLGYRSSFPTSSIPEDRLAAELAGGARFIEVEGSPKETPCYRVTLRSPDPQRAADLADALAEAVCAGDSRPQAAVGAVRQKALRPRAPLRPPGPSPIQVALLGAAAGALLGALVARGVTHAFFAGGFASGDP